MKPGLHEKYVDELTGLSKSQADIVAEKFLGVFEKFLRASDGDLNKFVGYVKKVKPEVMRQASPVIRKASKDAAKLGRQFGAEKRGKV